ncbi:MAG TPA: TIM barrel protein [Conexibacter sp.]|jgi:inosose dehydratase|nr:TIM barrel protein [Conexibacter sp.]
MSTADSRPAGRRPLATAPGTWGIEPPPLPDYPAWERVLDQTVEAGFDGSELGPYGYLPTDVAELQAALEQRGLAMPGCFVMEPFEQRERWPEIEAMAERTCALAAGAGAKVLIAIDGLTPERSASAGRSDAAPRLDEAAWQTLVEGVRRTGEIAARHGMRVAFHPHAGTYVEFLDEIDRIAEALEADGHGLCVDTGHSAYAGVDPVALVERHPTKVAHVHLKDVVGERLAEVTAAQRTFEQGVADGVFCRLGAGTVDLDGFGAALRAVGYDGWCTFEQDRVVELFDDALPEARASVEHVRGLGY